MRAPSPSRCLRALVILSCPLLATIVVGTPAMSVASQSKLNPKVQWLGPSQGSTISGVVSGSACQAVVQDSTRVTKVVFSVDGTIVWTAWGPPYTCRIDASTLPPGGHILQAKAHDAAGLAGSDYIYVSTPWSGPPRMTLTMQGDSLTGGSWWRIAEDLGPSFDLVSVSAKVGRSSVMGLPLLRRQPLGRVILFALGTNDWWDPVSEYRDNVEQVLGMAGPHRCVVVPTVWRNGRPMYAVNAALHSLARRYGPRRLQLAPWAETAAAGRVRLADGTHPDSQYGWSVRAQIVAAAVRACAAAVR